MLGMELYGHGALCAMRLTAGSILILGHDVLSFTDSHDDILCAAV